MNLRLAMVMASLAFALSACGGISSTHKQFGSFSAASTGSVSGLKAFQTGLYAFANQQGCVKCHGAATHPLFAAPDLTTAYMEARGDQIGSNVPLVDFNNPSSSIFATYAGNGHCGDTPCLDPSNEAVVKNLVESWASAEVSGSGGVTPTTTVAKYLTGSLPVPANLPSLTSRTPAVLRFPLSQLKPPVASLSGAIFEIEIQLASPTEYRLNRPKIAGNASAVTVSGIHVYLKSGSESGIGSEDAAQGLLWNQVSATAAVFGLPNPLPSGPLNATPLTTDAIALEVQSTSDVITIGFDNLQ